MGLLDFLKKDRNTSRAFCNIEPPIPESEKQYYRPDAYYTESSHPGTQFERKVITFEDRKKISYPSKNGLYVAEILLLEYVSYGTYPHPKNGYPGLWWFEYGIRNVGAMLESLEQRGYIKYGEAIDQLPRFTVSQLKEISAILKIEPKGNKPDIVGLILDNATPEQLNSAITDRKYKLTEKGQLELSDNLYVPYMHKSKKKTIECGIFGPEFNVWSINRIIGQGDTRDWRIIVAEQEKILDDRGKTAMAFTKSNLPEETGLQSHLKKQDEQIHAVQDAEKQFQSDGNLEKLISFWENIWSSGELLFKGSKWTFRLPDLYISQKRYDDAIRILKKIKNPAYQDKKKSYIEKIEKLKEKEGKESGNSWTIK